MKKVLIAVLSCTMVSGAFAAGFQASLTPNIAIQDRDTEINGFSIGVWNENPSGKFHWQAGFVNGTTGDSVGVQWLLLLPTFYNYAENFTGAQVGWVNYTSGNLTGLQYAFIGNWAGSLTGAQLGIVNIAKSVDGGFQGGLVNYAETANNLFQLGLVNIIADNEWFTDFPSDLAKGMVFVNWTFGE